MLPEMEYRFAMNTASKLILAVLLLCAVPTFAQQLTTRGAVMRSAVIPGLGAVNTGHSSGYVFMLTEAIFWGAYLYNNNESNLKETASYNQAYRYADVDSDGDFNESFYYNLGRYMSSGYEPGGYNAFVAETAQAKYPDDPAARQAYIDENAYDENHYWSWESEKAKYDYRILRKRITQYQDRAKLFTGAIIANHVISIIHTAVVSKKKAPSRLSMDVTLTPQMHPMLACTYRF